MTTVLHAEAIGAPTQLLIAGRWMDASDQQTFDVDDPATGDVIASVANGSVEDGLAAVAAASAALPAWAATPPRQRAERLRRTFELMTQRTFPTPEEKSPTLRSSFAGTPKRRFAPRATCRRRLPEPIGSSCCASPSG
jgi:hypothetical protein